MAYTNNTTIPLAMPPLIRSSTVSADGAVTDVSQEGAEQQRRGDGVGASISDLPESGYGWVILSACAVLAWWFVGINYTWGVLQATFVDDGVAQASTLSFVGSLDLIGRIDSGLLAKLVRSLLDSDYTSEFRLSRRWATMEVPAHVLMNIIAFPSSL